MRALQGPACVRGWRWRERWLRAVYLATAQGAPPNPLFTVWISLYYAAFYVVMTGLFALCIYVLMQTIDPYTPDYQDQLKSPGKHREDSGNALGATDSRAQQSTFLPTPGTGVPTDP